MWRRESIGAGSVAVADPSSSGSRGETNYHHCHHHQPHPPHQHQHPHQRHHALPRRFDSTELQDSPVRNEALKLVRELNRAVAGHVALAALLGGSGDGPNLRDELRRARRTAQEAAAAAKSTLLPVLLDQQKCGEKERLDLERIWYLLLCCLDALEMSMHRCLVLLREFSLADGNNVVIHTGIESPNHLNTTTNRSTLFSGTGTGGDRDFSGDKNRLSIECVECTQLCKELFELRAQLSELKTTVELRSLTIPDYSDEDNPHPPSNKAPHRTDTLISINGADVVVGPNCSAGSPTCSILTDDKESLESDASQGTGITSAQRKCICWILIFMVAMFFLAMVLGIFIALFS